MMESSTISCEASSLSFVVFGRLLLFPNQLIAVKKAKDFKDVQRMNLKESLLEQKWLRDGAGCGQGCRGGGKGEQIRHGAGGQEQSGGKKDYGPNCSKLVVWDI